MAKGRPGYSSQKPALPGGRAMDDMPVFGTTTQNAPGRNYRGQTPEQAKKAAAAVMANANLQLPAHYRMPDLLEDPTMRSERLSGEALGRQRGETPASLMARTYAHQTRTKPSANYQKWQDTRKKKQQEMKNVRKRQTFYDDQYMQQQAITEYTPL